MALKTWFCFFEVTRHYRCRNHMRGMNIIPLFAFFTLLVCFVILTACFPVQFWRMEWAWLKHSLLGSPHLCLFVSMGASSLVKILNLVWSGKVDTRCWFLSAWLCGATGLEFVCNCWLQFSLAKGPPLLYFATKQHLTWHSSLKVYYEKMIFHSNSHFL